jgi:hypothetical protein
MGDTISQPQTPPLTITLTTDLGTRRYAEHTSEGTVSALRADILQGTISKEAKIKFETKTGNANPKVTEGTLIECSSRYAQLADLYMPVRRYARSGIGYGIIAGIGLNLVLLGFLVIRANQPLGLAIIAVPICFGVVFVLLSKKKSAPALFLLAPPLLSCYISLYAFPQLLGAAFSGAVLGCMPGMTIGAIIGVVRRSTIVRAHDAPNEKPLLRIVIPLVISIAIWSGYLTLARNLLPRLLK